VYSFIHVLRVIFSKIDCIQVGTGTKKTSRKGKKGRKRANQDKCFSISGEGKLHEKENGFGSETYVRDALSVRLGVVWLMFQTMRNMSLPSMEGCPKAVLSCAELQTQLTVWKASSFKFREHEMTSGKTITLHGSFPEMAFTLTVGTPPKTPFVLELTEALDSLSSILEELSCACQISECNALREVIRFLKNFSSKDPNIVARSYILLYVLSTENCCGRHNFAEMLQESFVWYGIPPTLMRNEHCQAFISKTLKPIYEYLRLLTQNRARQRTRIEELLPDWGFLQEESSAIDDEFNIALNIPISEDMKYLFNLVQHYCLQLMIHYLQLGFELELFDIEESIYSFW
jgi:hypothetical protein